MKTLSVSLALAFGLVGCGEVEPTLIVRGSVEHKTMGINIGLECGDPRKVATTFSTDAVYMACAKGYMKDNKITLTDK